MKNKFMTRMRNMKHVAILLTSILFIGLTSCNFDKRLQEQEKDLITNFIQANNITVAPTESGLYYIETLLGDGPMAEDFDSVYVHYRTLLLSGQILDESYDDGQPWGLILGIDGIIEGFEEGLRMMHEGGKADLIIPSKLAYGAQGFGMIGSYTPLFIQIELVKVVPGPFIP